MAEDIGDAGTAGRMLQLRRSEEISRQRGGWFDACWHFSFDRYHDPGQMGVGALRVFNDDRILAGAAWPMHPHRDVESLIYVVAGDFEHADSLGNDRHLRPGATHMMTCYSAGDMHSERNGSDEEEPMRFIQCWILPSVEGLDTRVQQRRYETDARTGRWLQIMGPQGEEGLALAQEPEPWSAGWTRGPP